MWMKELENIKKERKYQYLSVIYLSIYAKVKYTGKLLAKLNFRLNFNL